MKRISYYIISCASDEQARNMIACTQMHSIVNTKRKNLEKRKEKLQQIEISLMGREEGSIEDYLSIGKQRPAINCMQNLQKKTEVLYFSLEKRAIDISRLAGMFLLIKCSKMVSYFG